MKPGKGTGHRAESPEPSAAPALEPIVLDRFTTALITWAAHRLAANNGGVYRAKFGVSLMEWRVILHLSVEPGVTASYLAQTIGCNKATISRTVDALHARSLVTETLNLTDSRSSHLFVTEAGAELYSQIRPVALEQEQRLLARLDPAEVEVFIDQLSRVVEALRKDGEEG